MIIENKSGFTQLYFLTVTLKPKWYQIMIKDQYQFIINQLNIHLKDFEYLGIPELTKSQNIHIHMVIRMPLCKIQQKHSVQRMVHDIFRKNAIIGYINIQPVMDYNKCMCYILKEIEQTYNELDMILVEQPLFNVNELPSKINIELNNIGFDYNDYIYFKQLAQKLKE